MSGLYQIRGHSVHLRPHAAQDAVLSSDRRFTFMIAGTQSGKTSLGPWWLWRQVKRYGLGDYLAVTATYDLFKLKMLPELRTVFCDVLGVGEYQASDRVILLRNGSRLILRSANSPGGLESATAKAAWLDECGQDTFDLLAWEAVQRRLSLSQGPVLGTTTPYNLGWLKVEVFDRWQAGDPDYLVVQAESTVNPAFPAAEFERAQRIMPAWKFAMFYRGVFTQPAGLIYNDYTEAVHMVAPFPIPVEWPRYVGIDFGAVNTATVWLAEDVQRKAYYLYRETLEGGQSTKEHAAAAKRRAIGERVISWHGGAKGEVQPRLDWAAAGVQVQAPPFDDVEGGIDKVIALLREKRLFVFSDCKMTRDQLGRYARVLDDNGQVTEKIRDKETFHTLDALRYVVLGQTARGWSRSPAG